jgi:PAS domain-containing protein
MFRVFNCLTEEHDWQLAVLAGLVCLLASLVAVNLYHQSRAARSRARSRHAWILLAGVAAGCGIWATHFIAIAACEPTVAASAGWTAVSLMIATIVAVAGLSVAAAALARWTRAHRRLANSMEQLRQQNIRLDTALNNMTQGLCMFNADEEIVVFNRRFLEMYKLSPQVVKQGCKLRDLIQHRLEVGLLDADVDEHYSRIMADIRHGKTATWLVKTTEGRLVQAFNQLMPGGGWLTTHEDVTERRLAEDQVREQKLQMDAALENMTQGLVMFDGATRIILWNRRYLELYNMAPDVMKPGLTMQELLVLRKAAGTFMLDPEIYVAELKAALLAGKPVTLTASAR